MSSQRRARGSTPVPRPTPPVQNPNPNESVSNISTASAANGSGDASFNAPPPGTPGSSAAFARSPLVAARIEEKQFLATCNNKLAAYIDRNRQLENENQRITTQLTTIQATHIEETRHIREVYDHELEETRRTLDKISAERAQLQLENAKFRTENDELKQRLSHFTAELDAAVKRADANEAKVADAQRRVADAEQARQAAVNQLNEILRNKAATERTLAEAQAQLEKETLARVEAQNLLQSTIERTAFQENVLKQQLTEARNIQEATVTKISVELQEEYDSRLEQALENMRSQYSTQIDQIRADVERGHQSKVNELRQQAERLVAEAKQARSELTTSRTRIEDLQSQLTSLHNQNQLLNGRLREAEAAAEKLRSERDENHEKLVAEIERLNAELTQLRQEHNELLESRITIDMELQAYRKMLDAEEERLSPHGLQRPRKRARRNEMGTPAGPGLDASVVTQKTEVRFTAQQHVSGPIEITDIDPDGRFIRLVNVGDSEVAMSGWQFKLSGGDLPTEVSHKFSRGFTLAAHQACTVWANAKVAPNPMPENDVLSRPNAPRFPAPSVTNPTVRATLQDNLATPNVVADVEVRREVIIVGSDASTTQMGSPGSRQCILM